MNRSYPENMCYIIRTIRLSPDNTIYRPYRPQGSISLEIHTEYIIQIMNRVLIYAMCGTVQQGETRQRWPHRTDHELQQIIEAT